MLKAVLFGGSAGVGSVVAYAGYRLVDAQPQAVLELVKSWGALGLIAVAGMVLWDRRQGETIAATRESAAAQQKLADAVQELARRDDRRAQEQDLLLSTISRNTETLLEKFNELEQERARGANA